MGPVIYALCALTSLTCAFLLLRAFRRSRLPLLFWSGLAFVAFAAANVVLFLDLVVVKPDLSLYRNALTLVGVVLLLYGLVFESARR